MTAFRVQELPVPDADAGEVRERADAIMARAEFSNPESILDRALRWLNDLVGELFDTLAGGGAGSVVGWGILIALAAALAYMLVRLQPGGGLGGRGAAGTAVQTSGPAVARHRSAADWRNEADRHTAEGSYDAALRARYRALLADLVGNGLLQDVAGRTPREYRRELADRVPGTEQRFAAATDQFELVWYGAEDATADDLAEFIRHEHAVLSVVGV